MNTEVKHQLDEELIDGTMTPEVYLAEVRAHCEHAVHADELGKSNAPKRIKRGLKQWQWRVLVPVVLVFSSILAEPVALPLGYVPSGGGGAQPAVTPDAKPKTLRDYYAPPATQPDLFSMPDPQTMARGSYPGQAGPPQVSPEEAYALGIAMSPLVQLQQEILAQQQEAARQKQQVQQMQQQQEAQRALEYAQRFQNMGVPHWARPPAGQQQAAPSNIQPAPTGGPCSYACDTCRLIQTYSSRPQIMPRCPRDGGSMRLMR